MRTLLLCAGVWIVGSSTAGASPRGGLAIPPELVPEESPGYAVLGIGGGGLTAYRGEPASQGLAWTLQMGYRLGDGVQLAFSGDYLSFARHSKDHSQQQAAVTLGVRQFPLAREYAGSWPGIFLRHVYIRAGLGVGHAIYPPYEVTFDPGATIQGGWGPAATVGVGWMPLKMRGGSLGIDVADTAVFYREGRRHNWGATVAIQLNIL